MLKDESNLLPLKGLDTTTIASVTIGASTPNPFQHYLKKQGNLQFFQAETTSSIANIEELKNTWLTCPFTLLAWRRYRPTATMKETTIWFFTSPYRPQRLSFDYWEATAVIVGYDNSHLTINAARHLCGIAMTDEYRSPPVITPKAVGWIRKRSAWATPHPKR